MTEVTDELLEGMDPDAALDEWIGDVVVAVEEAALHAGVPWDFAAMLARARALDPTVVSAEAVREAEQAEPVISLALRREQRGTREDPEFARMVSDVRTATNHEVALRTHGIGGIGPALARPVGGARRVAVAVAVLAAGLVLLFGAVGGVQMFRTAAAVPSAAALQQGDTSSTASERAVIENPATTARGPSRASPREAVPEQAAPEIADVSPEPPATSVASSAVATRVLGKPRKSKAVEVAAVLPTLTEKLAALDADAHAAWKSGDFAQAEVKFEALIELAGATRLADLAYGDLFTLARRRGDATREVALWKRYLARFADGRFADDARAGLCRRDAATPQACWSAYLIDFPKGSYRTQAQRAIGSPP